MSKRELIRGSVAKVVNEREVAINRGSKHGVTQGMVFAILAPEPIDIVDPETDEVLGQEDRPKLKVMASRVAPKYSICRTFRVVPGTRGFAGIVIPTDELMYGTPERVETLRTPIEERLPPLDEKDSLVKIGDRVVEQIEDD